MDQSLVHTFSWGNSYGPMVLKVLQKFPPTLVLVHGWLFPGKGTPKSFCDKDFAELLGELSGEIRLKTLVLLNRALEVFRNFFGTVRSIFWLWGSFLALELLIIDSRRHASGK